MNQENLRPFRSGEPRAREAGRKGGVASGEARRERIRELLVAELDMPHMFVPALESKNEGFMSPEDFYERSAGYSRRAAMVKRLVSMAVGGNIKAMRLVLEVSEGYGDSKKNGPEA